MGTWGRASEIAAGLVWDATWSMCLCMCMCMRRLEYMRAWWVIATSHRPCAVQDRYQLCDEQTTETDNHLVEDCDHWSTATKEL